MNFDLRANIGRISSYSDGLSWKWMGNSLVYAVGGGAHSTVISMMTGYALAKLDFRGKKVLIAAIPRSGSPWPGFTPGRHPERTAEAARIDGAGEFRTFRSVCARILAPGAATVILFAFGCLCCPR